MEGDGEVIITPVQNCSHCESGECRETLDGTECYCDDGLVIAADDVSCVNSTGNKQTNQQTNNLPRLLFFCVFGFNKLQHYVLSSIKERVLYGTVCLILVFH